MNDQPPDEGPRNAIPVTARSTEPQGPPTVSTEPQQHAPGEGNDRTQQAEGADQQVTVFAAVGGQPFFDRLVERFYTLVADDDVLLPLYPDPVDLAPARERLALFLAQYWGGPPTYSERRGHPRLRMRHAPFVIGERHKDHWIAAMASALEQSIPETPLDEQLRAEVHQRMSEYFDMAATHLVNHPDG